MIYPKFFFQIFAFLLLFNPTVSIAQGNLLVYPKRVIFDGSRRIQDINLANIGKDSATYLISLIQIRMKEDGTFENILEPDSGQYFATKYLRIYPRSVTLAPRESQTIRLQSIQTSNLPHGEYRSHIYFRATHSNLAAGEKDPLQDTTNVSVKLVPVSGITIPIIIRSGENLTVASISDISIDLTNTKKTQLNIYLIRTGSMSVYGDLLIDYVPEKGEKIRVGTAQGVAVYTPLLRRNIKLTLEMPPNVDYHHGKLLIKYVLPTAKRTEVFSEKELQLH